MYLKKYYKIARRSAATFNYRFSFEIFRYYPDWKRYLKGTGSPLENAIPWINFPAIEFLDGVSRPDMKVLEYGSGGSTLFWADRVLEVYSIEHDRNWAENVIAALKTKNKFNATVFHIAPDADEDFGTKSAENPEDYVSTDEPSFGFNYRKYVEKVNDFPPEYFDIIVVDGRARPSCIISARTRLKPGGYLVVDNTERDYYLLKTLPLLESERWQRLDFIGPVPYLEHFCKTTIFRKQEKL